MPVTDLWEPFYWDKLPISKVTDTIWDELHHDLQLDLSDLPQVFAAKPITQSKSQAPARKPLVVTVLDISQFFCDSQEGS